MTAVALRSGTMDELVMAGRQFWIAIIGCGVVAERAHLPAAKRLREAQVTLLVDTDRPRAEALARRYHIPHVAEDYTETWKRADAAIVALPHHLHAPVSIDLLHHGIHVLVEKPMAVRVSECNALIAAAEAGQAVLAVGLTRRFLYGTRWVKAALEAGVLGRIESFDVRLGSAVEAMTNWPAPSEFYFHKETCGGGTLIDLGSHVLDLLLWWLGDDVASFEYYDDCYGGVEADCQLHLTFASGVSGIVELSRTRNLRNTAILRGQQGEIEVGIHNNRISGRPPEILAFRHDGRSARRLPRQPVHEPFRLQMRDWLHAIATGTAPLVSPAEAARSVALIEACYSERRTWELPWLRPETFWA